MKKLRFLKDYRSKLVSGQFTLYRVVFNEYVANKAYRQLMGHPVIDTFPIYFRLICMHFKHLCIYIARPPSSRIS